MSEEVMEETQSAAEAETTVSQEDYNKLLADLEAAKNHNTALFEETKKAKAVRESTLEAARAAEEEAAKKSGNFEQLHKSSMEKNESLQNEINSLKEGIGNKECALVANSIANEIAEGQGAELLKTHILPNLKYVDGEVKILDSNGNLTVSTIEQFKTEIRIGGKYDILLKGNQASGGGASGGKSGGATNKIMTRSDFDALDPMGQMKFMKSGGKTID